MRRARGELAPRRVEAKHAAASRALEALRRLAVDGARAHPEVPAVLA
jgi:hypothetical protein